MFGDYFYLFMSIVQMVYNLLGMPIEGLVMYVIGVETTGKPQVLLGIMLALLLQEAILC